jgi:hypothetical protein
MVKIVGRFYDFFGEKKGKTTFFRKKLAKNLVGSPEKQ